MRTLAGFCLALLFATGLFAQRRSGYVNPNPGVRPVGSILQPDNPSGAPATLTFGSVLSPGAAVGVPQGRFQGRPGSGGGQRRGGAYPVAVPVYVGAYGYGGYEGAVAAAEPPQAQQPNVIVIYPPAPAYSTYEPARSRIVEVPREQLEPQEERVEPTHYLLAFKDRSIYSAVAYWVEGDTIHYFTAGNTHNQASVSLIDRELTRRLNEGGLEVKLPPAK